MQVSDTGTFGIFYYLKYDFTFISKEYFADAHLTCPHPTFDSSPARGERVRLTVTG
ncbi:hypothetical protein IMZ05_27550 [Klebsiella pneumoniae]|nr:hypothetical protein [Klebsiella pneumoniae]QPQ04996.1 hypothetical protein I5M61_27555 [Klebsiella pneumoniae]